MYEGAQKAAGQEQKEIEAEMQMNAIVRRLLDDSARARLHNVRLVNQELYLRAVQALVMLAQEGSLQGKMNEPELKELLQSLGGRKEITIKRK